MFRFVEVDGADAAEVLRSMNALDSTFPDLTDAHLETGFWWLLKTHSGVLCGFAGLVPNDPYVGVGYLKRAYVSPDYRGRGVQLDMIYTRVAKAHELGWHQLVTETTSQYSARNLSRAGFERVEPEQPWAGKDALYFSKMLR